MRSPPAPVHRNVIGGAARLHLDNTVADLDPVSVDHAATDDLDQAAGLIGQQRAAVADSAAGQQRATAFRRNDCAGLEGAAGKRRRGAAGNDHQAVYRGGLERVAAAKDIDLAPGGGRQ